MEKRRASMVRAWMNLRKTSGTTSTSSGIASLTRWRQRLGEEQIAALLQESLSRCAAHPPGDREARRDGQTRGRRAAPELLSARGQTRGHYGGALYACPPVQARSAGTQIPAHATWPHHPRRSPQDRGRCRTAGSLWSAARSCIAGSPSRAAPARTEGRLIARPRGGVHRPRQGTDAVRVRLQGVDCHASHRAQRRTVRAESQGAARRPHARSRHH